jgi:hypothetical protein
MAILDPRLLALIETLAAEGADWLAFELVDGIQRGRESEEPEEALASARERVRFGEGGPREPLRLVNPTTPILGDDQIGWAATYVSQRLDSALNDLAAASDALNEIAAATSSQRDGVEEQHLQDPPAPIKIVINDEEVLTDSHGDIETARDAIVELRSALENWSSQVRRQPQA